MVMGLASATIEDIGTAKQNTCVSLMQQNQGVAYETLSSIQLPDKTFIVINKNMTSQGLGFYNYSFCNTTQIGTYFVNGFDTDESWSYYFEITPSGRIYTMEEGITYLFLFLLIISLGVFLIWASIKIPYDNYYDGTVFKINYGKHLKIFLIVIAYLVGLISLYIGWNVSLAYIHLPTVAKFFLVLFRIGLALLIPGTITYAVLTIVIYVRDKKWLEDAKRGLYGQD
jgi:hypothetical protein